MNKDTKSETQSSSLSPQSSAVPPAGSSAAPSGPAGDVPENAKAHARRRAFMEAAHILSAVLGNAGDRVAQVIEHDKPDDIRRGLADLQDILQRAHTILSEHIEDLPAINVVPIKNTAPTA